MGIQHRYIRFLCHLLGNDPLETVYLFSIRFAILYTYKHESARDLGSV